ncbi:MAG TPA: arsinothricin resistance N-acetyltransferase ArsN1 family B [Candidatus Limnocylindria bacterium]|nr:arsinothricin resistance N-acetyltransferase ArsN1 family B [Candidatus Limnocylindria bacterium]
MIRLALERDTEQIAGIYAPVVRDTAISFEVEPPTAAEMARRLADSLPHFPWLVADHAGEILGYVYAGTHRARAAYRWSVDTTVYVHPRVHRAGVGRALYTSLLQVLAIQGFYTAYAGITLPNAGSVGLHEAVGFQPLGVYRGVGYKLGAWHDVGWWERAISPRPPVPAPPLAMAAAQAAAAWHAALTSGAPWLRL